jgi:hypothetical protein
MLRRWRSETLTALTNRPPFVAQRRLQSDRLAMSLAAMLKIFVPRTKHRRFLYSIQESIIEPALRLAHKLHLSINRFECQWTLFSKTRPSLRGIEPTMYNSYDCLDLFKDGRLMKPQAFVKAESITYMLDLSPELIFKAVRANTFAEPASISRAKILVATTPKGVDSLLVPSEASREDNTLIAWLLDYARKSRNRQVGL